jgi:hypothetical protein
MTTADLITWAAYTYGAWRLACAAAWLLRVVTYDPSAEMLYDELAEIDGEIADLLDERDALVRWYQ